MATYYYLFHFISQFTFRWNAYTEILRELENQTTLEKNILDLNLSDWENLITKINSHLEKFFKEYSLNEKILSEKIFFELQNIKRSFGKIITWADPLYPHQLKTISDPPLAITCLGNTELLRKDLISVIGSRKASREALALACDLAKELAHENFSIVSGGALGCDIAAHYGVIKSMIKPCPAIVVFAGGLHSFYPTANEFVFRKLLSENALFISEKLWFHKPHPYDFPIRNRIVSGLSEETLIIQAGKNSGAMTTARFALDQGREVWVWEGMQEYDARLIGNYTLIEEGAKKFFSIENFFDQRYCNTY